MIADRAARFCIEAVALAALALAAVLPAAGSPLPRPLTLEQALALADDEHPDLALAQARLEAARAGQVQADAESGMRATLDVTPQWILPSLRTTDEFVNDSRARLQVSKRLYDFGRHAALAGSALAEFESRGQQLLDVRQARRLDIMARYLDVLLADLRYAVDNEAMAFNYVRYDKSRERHRLGQISDIDLLELQSRYEDSLITRTRSQKRQAQTRQQLALALNHPDELPADLVLPKFPGNDREPPDFKAVLTQAQARDPAAIALRKQAEAARSQVDAERARRYPVISVEGELARYEREFASQADVRATLNLRVPIWQAGEDRAAIATALARQNEVQARLQRADLDLRQTVLDLVQDIETLRIERNAAKVRSAWRDLYLDRSRAYYDLEVRTDLGDAMTRVTEAQWQAAQVEFRLALAWARLDALTGRLLESPVAESAK